MKVFLKDIIANIKYRKEINNTDYDDITLIGLDQKEIDITSNGTCSLEEFKFTGLNVLYYLELFIGD